MQLRKESLKKKLLYGIRNLDLCDTGAALCQLILMSQLGAGTEYDFHIFIISSSSFHGFITNKFDDLLPVGLLA